MKIRMLDCTLRDGGYINNWKFDHNNIKIVIEGLVEAGINIIECGYLHNCENYNPDYTKFTNLHQINSLIDIDISRSEFAVMVNFGEYDFNALPNYEGGKVSIIRLAFHKRDMEQALKVAELVKDKGYKLFLQPMVSLGYTDKEFLDLIVKVNLLCPYAFYIVDSFGVMKKKDLIRLFLMVEHNLEENIRIGYHSHNNMQLAFSNAQALVEEHTIREIIIDTTIMGMGRGAGNLNTELFSDYLNEGGLYSYNIQPLLQVSDKVLSRIYTQKYWGYSLPYYVSASYNCHPNYASYLADKNSLTVDEMNMILSQLPTDKRASFDKSFIEKKYLDYMSKDASDETKLQDFIEKIRQKDILIIAPGKSSLIEKEKISKFSARHDVITIAINHNYAYCKCDYVFFGNIRRYKTKSNVDKERMIITSNIAEEGVYLKLNYRQLINDCEGVSDNSGLMFLKFLLDKPIRKVYLAGMDGYGLEAEQNYSSDEYVLNAEKTMLQRMNAGMNQLLLAYSRNLSIQFLTKPHFIGAEFLEC